MGLKTKEQTMRINEFQNIPAILQSLSFEKASKAEPKNESGAPSTSVSLSSFAEVLQSLQRGSAQAANARTEKVGQLAQQVQSGKLNLDLEKLASRLIQEQVINPKG
jgi:flagellar biosynthesis anti-sigma factor FlgM